MQEAQTTNAVDPEFDIHIYRYVCNTCGQAFHTAHLGTLLTPFTLKCRKTPGCCGDAHSTMIRYTQPIYPEGVDGLWLPPLEQGDRPRLVPVQATTATDPFHAANVRRMLVEHSQARGKTPAISTKLQPAGSAYNRIRTNPRIAALMKPKRGGG